MFPVGEICRAPGNESKRTRIVSTFTCHCGATNANTTFGEQMMRYMLLWILGVPIPVLILIWLLWGH